MGVYTYVNRETNETWTSGGRGRYPNFVLKLINSGVVPDFRKRVELDKPIKEKSIRKPRCVSEKSPPEDFRGEKLISIDINAFAGSLNLTVDDAVDLLSDGRVSGHIVEPNVARVENLQKHPDGFQGHDLGVKLIENQVQVFNEVRVMTERGVTFLPNFMLGKGRFFDEEAWRAYMTTFAGWYICDINHPHLAEGKIYYYYLKNTTILEAYDQKKIGRETKISRKQFFSLNLHKSATDVVCAPVA